MTSGDAVRCRNTCWSGVCWRLHCRTLSDSASGASINSTYDSRHVKPQTLYSLRYNDRASRVQWPHTINDPEVSTQPETTAKSRGGDCDTRQSVTIAFNLIRNIWCQQCLAVLKSATIRGRFGCLWPSVYVCLLSGLLDFGKCGTRVGGQKYETGALVSKFRLTPPLAHSHA